MNKQPKIFFVGMHNKPGMSPLDSKTISGKVIDRIIKALPNYRCVKTNLCDVDYFVKDHDEVLAHNLHWSNINQPTANDTCVLLGAWVHSNFLLDACNIVKLAHPAAWCQWPNKDEYVKNALIKINPQMNKQQAEKLFEENADLSPVVDHESHAMSKEKFIEALEQVDWSEDKKTIELHNFIRDNKNTAVDDFLGSDQSENAATTFGLLNLAYGMILSKMEKLGNSQPPSKQG